MKPNNHSSILLAAAATLAFGAAFSPRPARAALPDGVVKTLYTESTGEQFIDTGVLPALGLKFEATFEWMEPADSSTDNSLVGARTSGANDRFFPIHNTQGVMLVGAGAGGERYPVAGSPETLTVFDVAKTQGRGVPIVEGQRYTVVADIAAGRQTIERDGVLVHAGTLYDAFTPPPYNLYLFACNISGTALQRSKVRLFSFRIWRDGALVRDYIPCTRDGVGGFWEDVDKKFVASDSATALVSGPELALEHVAWRTPYTESTGQQHIDTGIRPSLGLKFEASFEWMEPAGAPTDNSLVGARTSGANDRFFPIHNTEGVMLVGAGASGARYPVAGSPETLTDYNGARTQGRGVPIVQGQRYTVVADIAAGRQTIVRDGELVHAGTLYDAFTPPPYNLYLFACNISGTASQRSKVRLFAFRIWKDGALVRDYIPCTRFDGVGGFWEDVEKEFVGSASSTPFTAAPRGVAGAPDAFADWIASDGTQYFNTGVRAAYDMEVEGKLRFLDVNVNREHGFLGASYTASDPRRYLMPVHLVGNKLWFAGGAGNETGATGNKHYVTDLDGNQVVATADTDHEFRVKLANGEQTFVWDGDTLFSGTTDNTTDVGYNLYLFAQCQNGAAQHVSAARCYGLKIWKDSVLVRDYVPGIRDGEGCLYDRVGDICYFASTPIVPGSGIGVPAADPVRPCNHLEYVETEGTQFVNLGVAARRPVKIEATVAKMDISGDVLELGARNGTTGDRRFYPFHLMEGYVAIGPGGYGYLLTDDTSTLGPAWRDNNIKVAAGDVHTYTIEFTTDGTVSAAVDGTVYYQGTAATVDLNLPLYLFAANIDGSPNNGGACAKMRVYSLKIWQDGRLVRNLVPVIAKNGAPYLYDKASGGFFNSANDFGIWTHGPVGEAIHPGTVITLR